MHFRRLLPFALALTVAACGGGGGGGAVAPTSANAPGAGSGGTSNGNTSKAAQSVQVNMHVPGTSATSSTTKRSPQFVAASTQGVLVVVYATSDTAHTTPLGSSATNVAPGSAACGGASGARTCSVTIPAPPGQDDFVFTTYDQPPSSGTAFPSNANVLATGTVTNQTISAASANVVNVTLSGALSQTRANPYQYSLLAGAGPQSYTLEFNALDAGGNVILGPYVDVNGNPNPITITVQETGGSGLTKVAVDGGPPGTTGVVSSSSDIVTVSYTGGGSPGYYVTLSNVSASGAPLSPTLDPAFISSTSPAWTGGTNSQLNFTTPGQAATITMNEANFTGTFGINQNCQGVLTYTFPSAGPTESFTATASSAGGSCVLTLYDGHVVDNINVTAVSNTSSSVAVPGSLLAYTADGPTGVGIRTAAGVKVGSIATTSSADNIAMDDAGDVYVVTQGSGLLAKYVPSATGYPPTYTKASATYTLTNPSGVFAVQASGAGEIVAFELNSDGTQNIFDIWDAGATGSPSRTITVADPTFFLTYGEELAHDGNFYYAAYVACPSNASLQCVEYSVVPPGTSVPSRTFVESIVAAANQTSFYPSYATIGPDGTLYQTVWDGSPTGDPNAALYIYPPTGNERIVKTGAYTPEGIDIDSVGNLYIVNNNTTYSGNTTSADTSHILYEVSPDGTTVLRTVSLFPNPLPIVVAPDGTAFVSSFNNTANAANETGGAFSILPTAYTTTQIDTYSPYNIVLYDGTAATETAKARAPLSIGSGTAHAGGFLHRRHP